MQSADQRAKQSADQNVHVLENDTSHTAPAMQQMILTHELQWAEFHIRKISCYTSVCDSALHTKDYRHTLIITHLRGS